MSYVYHPVEGAKIVLESDYYNHLENGWYDTPAKFPKNEIAVLEKVAEPAQEAKELTVEEPEIIAKNPIRKSINRKKIPKH